MIPLFRFGLYSVDSSFRNVIENVFGPSQEISMLESVEEVEAFLGDIGFPSWKVLVAQVDQLLDGTFLAKTALHTYLNITTFHLVLWAGKNHPEVAGIFKGKENVHIVEADRLDSNYQLEHHFHGIKSILDSYWLYAKSTDVLHLYESVYLGESDHKRRILSFLASLQQINEAQSISVFLLENGSTSFDVDLQVGTPPFRPALRTLIEKLFEFSDTCLTHIVDRQMIDVLIGDDSARPDQITILSTFTLDEIPGFVVYTFDPRLNLPLAKVLCGISSREIFHLYRARQIRSEYETLKAISEIGGLDAEKPLVLYKILFKLKAHFDADGVAIVELVFDQNNNAGFQKTFIERANKGQASFPYRGFAEHCIANRKALMITETVIDGTKPFGIGFEYDPDRLGIDQGKPVRIETFRAPRTFEDEKSLMYFPFRYRDLSGAIKVSDFTRPNGFSLQQLRALSVYADPVASLLGSLQSISELKAEVEKKSAQEEMLDIAEVLFFYREITLGIFHQVGNHLDTIQSEMLMLELLGSRRDKPTELAEHLSEAKVQIRFAKDLINKAHQRGLSLNPIEQSCDLVRDVIRPALDYARKRTKGTSVEIKQSLSSEEYPTKLDVDLAKESFINLLNNSIWAVKSNKTAKKEIFIAVRKTSEGDYARVEIEDSGIGIEPENFRKLFSPGFTTRPGGTGLGLYFTRKLLEHFGGSVEVMKSNPGKGTTVVVTIPVTREDR